MHTLEHLRPTAVRAFNGTSFSPEKRGDVVIKEYSQEIDGDLYDLKILGIEPEEIERYKKLYEALMISWLNSHANVVSSMIAGPSKFPAQRMLKRGKWADNKYNEWRSWRERALKGIRNKYTPKEDELKKLTDNLTERQQLSRIMVEANKICKKKEQNMVEQLNSLGICGRDLLDITRPEFGNKTGYPGWRMQNNNAEIRRLKKRIDVLQEKKRLAAECEAEKYDFLGGSLVVDYQADRVRVFHDARPPQDTINSFRAHGFKWTPNGRCWQRIITEGAKEAACKILGLDYKELQNKTPKLAKQTRVLESNTLECKKLTNLKD